MTCQNLSAPRHSPESYGSADSHSNWERLHQWEVHRRGCFYLVFVALPLVSSGIDASWLLGNWYVDKVVSSCWSLVGPSAAWLKLGCLGSICLWFLELLADERRASSSQNLRHIPDVTPTIPQWNLLHISGTQIWHNLPLCCAYVWHRNDTKESLQMNEQSEGLQMYLSPRSRIDTNAVILHLEPASF